MSKSRKIIFFIIGGTVGLFLLVIIGLMIFVDANRFKPRLETAASNILEMEVVLGGKIKVSLFRGLRVSLNDVHLRNQGVEVASVPELILEIGLWPLLGRDIQFTEIILTEPTITITKDERGKFNVGRTGTPSGGLPGVNFPHVSLTDATLIYADEKSGRGLLAHDCRIDVYDLRIADGNGSGSSQYPDNNPGADPGNDVTFSGELECDEIRADGYQIFDLRLAADKDATHLNLMPITLVALGALGSGSILADFSAGAPLYRVQFSLPQFPIESFFSVLTQEQTAERLAPGTGAMDFSAGLSMQGKTIGEMTRSANGNFSLRGKDLILNGIDLDSLFEEFESSQNFSLIDLGAFFYAGPLALILTKGYDFTGILLESGGHSEISSLVSEWQVESGVAKAVDVAMATKENRIALHGELDFVNGRYGDVTVAVIDAIGCIAVEQKIHGDFREPVLEQPNILKSLTGPVISLLEKGRDLFPGGECDIFYAGSVAPPE